MCVHLWGPVEEVLYLPCRHLAPVLPSTASSSLSFPFLQISMLCSTTIFPMLYILDLACFFLSVLFYVPEKAGVVHTWIHENVSVEKWNKVRHASLLGFISQEGNLGGLNSVWYLWCLLFCYFMNACDMLKHRDTFQMSAERNGTEISNMLLVLISLFTQGLKCVVLV